MPVNPNIAATTAIIMKIIVQRNIGYSFRLKDHLPVHKTCHLYSGYLGTRLKHCMGEMLPFIVDIPQIALHKTGGKYGSALNFY